MPLQVFGHPKSKASRKVQRWLKERRIPFSYVDVTKRPPSPGELRRFVQKFGAEGVLDPESKTYQDKGLRYVSASDDDWITRMVDDPTVLRLPLVRNGNELAVGDDEQAWARLSQT
ncbi:MAG TPA: ArsC/Spx/MgsR family protein [Egibacteraceae bacterium]|nr:ArsC/Spx/MgsR family protein [Egibacteraceae bacterium]